MTYVPRPRRSPPIAEQLLLSLGHEDRKSEFTSSPQRPRAVIPEEVSAQQRDWEGGEFPDVVDPFPGARIDDEGSHEDPGWRIRCPSCRAKGRLMA